MKRNRAHFGHLPDGRAVEVFTLSNDNDMTVKILNYGGVITSITIPDKNGNCGEVTLGYDHLEGYLDKTPYFGAIVGRYGNRIANGEFMINGLKYTLVKNNGPHHLHGGTIGFDKVMWTAKEINMKGIAGVELEYLSGDMEEGYPGNLRTIVVYTLNNANKLKIDYMAETDKPTHINLTNHTYFNLKDGGATPHLGHIMQINADYITRVDKTLIPTGELWPVGGTPFDFRQPTPIGDRIDADHEQIKYGGGYDHNFVINGEAGQLRWCARVFETTSGRRLEVLTTEPGVQFYTGNFLDGTISGIGGRVYHRRHGFCLENQHYPDSPNKPEFPSTLLHPGQHYHSTTIFKFSWE